MFNITGKLQIQNHSKLLDKLEKELINHYYHELGGSFSKYIFIEIRLKLNRQLLNLLKND
jgi:hypothetical protein